MRATPKGANRDNRVPIVTTAAWQMRYQVDGTLTMLTTMLPYCQRRQCLGLHPLKAGAVA
jgi:hypothetical protein